MRARDNPFATQRLERVLAFDPELIGESWAGLLTRWERLGRQAAVVGPWGSGKSSFLDGFAERVGGRVERLFFNRDLNRLSEEDRKHLERGQEAVWVVDGDQHLPWLEARFLLRSVRRSRGGLFARHRAGRAEVLLRLQSDPDLAEALLRRAAPGLAEAWIEQLPGRWRRHRGNLRHLFLEYYDQWAEGDFQGSENIWRD
ncbi:MAG: hypothetical protein ACQKBU_06715 [Verrucomicrobiales bacterium]